MILLAVIVFVLFNLFQWPFTNLLALFKQLEGFNWYAPVFWSSLAVMFAAAVVVAARAKKQVIEGPKQKLSAIKALLPFGHNEDDIEIFARLQREQNLDECLQAMSDPHWRFGLICGESGAGKTSFLQAGLWPALEAQKYRCVYVKFSDLDPFQSVEQARVKELSLPKEHVNGDGLLTVIRKATTQDAKTVVLIFDQFEQFFVHCKRKKDRKPFVQELTDWYNREQSLPVKILISIRGDFFYRLNELQEAMKYSLSPAQSFRLERFEPPQAAEIFCAIAEKESLDYNRSFINEVTRQELADSDDGLISPVDIQVLAWMVAGQSDKENRAFNRTAFQKLGGVEGLLERYLTRALDVRETESRRQAAIKVMLGLTDLERNTRAGALTIVALREKLKDDLSDAELKEAVTWLSRSDVRLIAPLTENQEEKFELAHERIIPAVRKLANKTLEPVARVNQLLDSRVNEWIGNGRNSRYLFSPSELRLIRKQKSFITWGKNRSIKDDLIAVSKKRLKIRFALACLTILLFTGGWFIWGTNRVQLSLMKSDLKDYGLRLNGDTTLGEIAKAFYVSGDFQLASQILDRIESDSSKVTALRSTADIFIKLGDKDRALSLLNDSLKSVDKINSDSDKANALSSIANAFIKLGDKENGQVTLNYLVKIAEKINDDSSKAEALSAIANAFAKLGEATKDVSVIKESFAIVEKVSDDSNRYDILLTITESRMVFNDIKSLRSLASYFSSETSRAKALARILTVYAHPELVEKDKPSDDEESEDER